jgi:hypothetical protein
VGSTPASRSRIAAVCRSTWKVTFLFAKVAQAADALAAWRAIRRSIASRLRGVPVRVGNNRAAGLASHSASHMRSTLTTGTVKGVMRSFRPLPQYCSLDNNFRRDALIERLRSSSNPKARHLSFHAARIALAAALHCAAAGNLGEKARSPVFPLLRGERPPPRAGVGSVRARHERRISLRDAARCPAPPRTSDGESQHA